MHASHDLTIHLAECPIYLSCLYQTINISTVYPSTTSDQPNQDIMSTSTQPTTTNPTSPTSENPDTKEAHLAFTTSLKTISSNYDGELQERAKTLHENASALDAQEAALRRTTADLARQNEGLAGLAGLAGEVGDGLKEIGDVQNWAELIERDLLVVEDVLRTVEAEDGVGIEDDGDDEEGLQGRGEGEGMNGVGGGKDKKTGVEQGEGGGPGGGGGWMKWW